MTENQQIAADNALDAFFGDGSITEVLSIVRSGKEATVYCCRADTGSGRGVVAAKVYHPLEKRGFRNDAVYQTGRGGDWGSRNRRAFANKSHHGRSVQYATWIGAEYETLEILYGAGADVPEPIAIAPGAILMEYFGDETAAAPMLVRAEMDSPQAQECLRGIIQNVALWLTNHRVHGDLSPYNLLYWGGRAIAIDFPQAVDARMNPNAHSLLLRDLENVCGHFTRAGINANAIRIADDLWRRYRLGQ
jgi:RIO kinase 1